MPERKVRRDEVVCAVCEKKFFRERYEIKRNAKLGRVNLCDRSCQATWMNLSPAKQAQTKAMLSERNSRQWRADNSHWKGGVSRLKSLPSTEENSHEQRSDGPHTARGPHERPAS